MWTLLTCACKQPQGNTLATTHTTHIVLASFARASSTMKFCHYISRTSQHHYLRLSLFPSLHLSRSRSLSLICSVLLISVAHNLSLSRWIINGVFDRQDTLWAAELPWESCCGRVTLEISPHHTHAQTATRHKHCQWPLVSTEYGHSCIFEVRQPWDFLIFALCPAVVILSIDVLELSS